MTKHGPISLLRNPTCTADVVIVNLAVIVGSSATGLKLSTAGIRSNHNTFLQLDGGQNARLPLLPNSFPWHHKLTRLGQQKSCPQC